MKKKMDINELANYIANSTTTEGLSDKRVNEGKNLAAMYLGHLGGLKGGKARAAKLSPERRVDIAKKAAQKRWNVR